MAEKLKYDFSGWATKYNVACSDGRTIKPPAFKDCDGMTVPLVFSHQHNDLDNVIGKAFLEHRDEGVYGYFALNDTAKGKTARELIKHGDLTALSIFANKLKQSGGDVLHGMIRETSVVLAGANPEAFIDNVILEHADGSMTQSDQEAVIYFPEEFDNSPGELELRHAESNTLQEIFDTFNEEQKNVAYAMVAAALSDREGEMQQSAINNNEGEGETVKTNVFSTPKTENTIAHDAMITPEVARNIFADAVRRGSLKEAVLAHAGTYGINDIELLFPDARELNTPPEFISRRMEWVNTVLNGVHRSPFSRIKTTQADITVDTARALGYVKGNLKKEEVFGLLQRITMPTTVYKKQKLDRDDIIDITDFDVVRWLHMEMRMMLDEELARATLIGDGRDADSEDKIKDGSVDGIGIRPIYLDNDLYSHHILVPADRTTTDLIEDVFRAQTFYKGSGSPTFFTTRANRINMLLVKDAMGRRLYESDAALATALGVSRIVDVEVMENINRTVSGNVQNLLGIIVNLRDYNIGADRGGQVTMFGANGEFFDIDYNQYKYLIETRCSGALTRVKSAIVVEQLQAAG